DRWNTFADYVQQSSATVQEQKMTIAGLLSIKNEKADKDLNNWRWSTDEENTAVNAMLDAASQDEYKGYNTLATYKFNDKELPIKVGVGVALKFLDKAPPVTQPTSEQQPTSAQDMSAQADN
ncbi:hypothetical protein, partial [Xanthovirga aplysinae]|uniref:hypothetical protein n=1 Tax=Xanthovirga aplysinae TaxID=2529853 RepID=UPI001CA4617C